MVLWSVSDAIEIIIDKTDLLEKDQRGLGTSIG